jgi:hypothetical protein
MSFIYIVGKNKKYLTNKTNVTRLWEVVTRELEEDKDLEISYQKHEKDDYFTTVLGRKEKIKQLCQDAVRNRIIVHLTDDFDGDQVTIFQDLYRGRD